MAYALTEITLSNRNGPANRSAFDHSCRVATKLTDPHPRTVAYLHDILRDNQTVNTTHLLVFFSPAIVTDIL